MSHNPRGAPPAAAVRTTGTRPTSLRNSLANQLVSQRIREGNVTCPPHRARRVPPVASGGDAVRLELPGSEPGPLRRILWRVALALGLIAFVALLTYLGRDGYVDPEDDSVSLLDAFYYSTVSITTTGYGDIRPVTDETRLLTTILVTPARVLFLILLVGTTLEILAQRSRDAYRQARWRRTLKDHIIICGFGVKG